MLHFIIRLALMVLALLIVVPAVTGGRVAVRQGGFLKGLLSLFVIGLTNSALWFAFALLTAGGAVVINVLTVGILAVLVNALAFVLAGKFMPDTLHVESFGSAIWASVAMTFASYFIQLLF